VICRQRCAGFQQSTPALAWRCTHHTTLISSTMVHTSFSFARGTLTQFATPSARRRHVPSSQMIRILSYCRHVHYCVQSISPLLFAANAPLPLTAVAVAICIVFIVTRCGEHRRSTDVATLHRSLTFVLETQESPSLLNPHAFLTSLSS
jgi:hypothetical protein